MTYKDLCADEINGSSPSKDQYKWYTIGRRNDEPFFEMTSGNASEIISKTAPDEEYVRVLKRLNDNNVAKNRSL